MKYPEKKAATRKYRIRQDPVTHLNDAGPWAMGRRRAVCCVRVGVPRHDDGFTFDPALVTCTSCNRELARRAEHREPLKDGTGCDV